ncbi:MAG TPA: penicillin acylase family protein, partial [Anaerolineaceae bacterium]|nr:penicillin acylase family protein [Anaerolineaceae bacterium]
QLSEVFGALALDTDRAARTFGFERNGKADFATATPELRESIEAYTRGVNAFLSQEKLRLPVEFTLLRFKPRPWSVEDSMALARLMYWQMSHAWYSEIVRAQLQAAVGEEHAAEWEIHYPPENPAILPKGIEFNRLMPDGSLRGVGGPFLDRAKGSNAWAISGRKSVTGQPFLCNDMHLVMSLPTIWYAAHLCGGDTHVSGVTMPGVLGVVVGHNERIAWGITLAFTDCEDLYIEKFDPQNPQRYEYRGEWQDAQVIEEPICVKGKPEPFVEKVRITRHGPVISEVVGYPEQCVAVNSMALRPSSGLNSFLILGRAKGWNDFVDAMRHVNATQLNFAYADIEGNTGYWVTGATPIRAKGDGSLPSPGWTGEYEWVGEIPFEEMPHAFNPEAGFVVTANHRIIPDDYPYFLGRVWMTGYRARRLTEMLQSKEKLGPDDFCRIQMDVTSLPSADLIRRMAGLNPPDDRTARILEMLRGWDGRLTVDSVSGALYEVIRYTLVRRLLEPKLGRDLTNHLMGEAFNSVLLTDHEYFGYDTVSLLRILDDPDSWWMAEAGGCEALLLDSIRQAADWLTAKLGANMQDWQWGKLHTLTYPHAMGIQKPLDKVFNRGPFPVGGDTDSPLQAALTPSDPYENKMWAPSCRFIMDVGDWTRSVMVTPLGQSGQLGSRHYDDMIDLYLNGKYHPMSWTREQVEANLEARLTLKP